MAVGKFLITAAVCTAVLFGCAQKEKAEDKEFSSTPKPAAKSTTSDVFDEFYVDEGKTDKKDTEASAASSYVPQFSENGRYSVQVATHATRGTADQLSSEFNGKGYPAYVAAVDNPTPELMGTYYRIRIGTFDWYSQAKAFGENILRPAGYDYWIDKKSNDNVGIQGSGFGSESSYSEPTTDYSTTTSQPQEETSDWSSTTTETETSNDWSSTETETAEAETSDWSATSETAETEAAAATETQPATAEPAVQQPATEAAAQPVSQPAQPASTEPAAETTTTTETTESTETSTDDDWGTDDWGTDDWGTESDW